MTRPTPGRARRSSTRPSLPPARPRRQARRLGQSLVEFALVGPMILLVVFGVVDFGRAYFHQNQLTNAAREGARLAILRDHMCNTVVGPSSDCSANAAGMTGASVCQAILNEGDLIATGNWHCSEGTSSAGQLPAAGTGAANNAYVEIDQFPTSASSTTACDATTLPGSSMASNYWYTPRGTGYHSVEVKIDYYFRPLTPLVSGLFPSTFHISATACARAEY